jgi:hypothetical protein
VLAWQALAPQAHPNCRRVASAGTEKEGAARGALIFATLAALASLAAGGSRVAGGLRTSLEVSEVALGPAVRFPALAARFHRAARGMLLRRGGPCGKR